MRPGPVAIVGAGLAGSLLGSFLARRGFAPQLFERRPDMRREAISAGRSINLALADRGIHALERAGVLDAVRPLMIPMRGRAVHGAPGESALLPYGQNEREVIYSVSRAELNKILMDEFERRSGTRIRFRHSARELDPASGALVLLDECSGASERWQGGPVLATDGASSALRAALVRAGAAAAREELLPHRYKELAIPPGPGGAHQLDPHALHIWPRGEYMLIALANTDGSFTVTLFLPAVGAESFAALHSAEAVRAFFSARFPDAAALMPGLECDFAEHPTGTMVTVHCEPWHAGGRVLLLGDAAHAIVPFHGQGMNCAFEDCAAFDALLDVHDDWPQLFAAFEHERRPNAAAIAQMALENYIEMRDSVRSRRFQLQKSLALELERRFPERFVPRYSMVMFHHEIAYAQALERGRLQQAILDELTGESLDSTDWERARELCLARLAPAR